MNISRQGLLLVAANRDDRERLPRELAATLGLPVRAVRSLEHASDLAATDVSALALCPITEEAVAASAQARRRFAGARIIVIGDLPPVVAFDAARAGADAFVSRPAIAAKVVAVLRGLPRPEPRRDDRGLPSLARAEWEYMHSMLSRCDGNRSETARRLGIHRSVLQRKLSRHPPLW